VCLFGGFVKCNCVRSVMYSLIGFCGPVIVQFVIGSSLTEGGPHIYNTVLVFPLTVHI
jgi:hypothetical protein